MSHFKKVVSILFVTLIASSIVNAEKSPKQVVIANTIDNPVPVLGISGNDANVWRERGTDLNNDGMIQGNEDERVVFAKDSRPIYSDSVLAISAIEVTVNNTGDCDVVIQAYAGGAAIDDWGVRPGENLRFALPARGNGSVFVFDAGCGTVPEVTSCTNICSYIIQDVRFVDPAI